MFRYDAARKEPDESRFVFKTPAAWAPVICHLSRAGSSHDGGRLFAGAGRRHQLVAG